MTTAAPNETWPAVFLDRDGTIMRDVNYCADPAKVEIFPGVTQALQQLKSAGFKIIVITNQSGLGRGYFSDADYRAVEAEVARKVGPGLIDATYFCPDHPEAKSHRRKPEPKMVFEAEREHRLDRARSFFVGDKAIDAACGRNAGVRTILVQNGAERHHNHSLADWIVNDFAAAAEVILRHAI
ncbi:MAG: D-glycero-alpha-D-manno-heptose-1,7-bisphosphate 7-phosphatase [Chthoniobacterales bacterium]